jgi:hypothetical protein
MDYEGKLFYKNLKDFVEKTTINIIEEISYYNEYDYCFLFIAGKGFSYIKDNIYDISRDINPIPGHMWGYYYRSSFTDLVNQPLYCLKREVINRIANIAKILLIMLEEDEFHLNQWDNKRKTKNHTTISKHPPSLSGWWGLRVSTK